MTHQIQSNVPRMAAGVGPGLGRLIFSTPRTLKLWYERHRQRRRLAQLDERLLRDIGIDRAEAMREVSKAFWEA